MRALLIDPFTQTVTDYDLDEGIQAIYDATSCDCITSVRLPDHAGIDNCIFVDDEGLYREGQEFFTLIGYPQPIAGRGLVVGIDREGDTISTSMPLPFMQAAVKFPSLRFTGMTEMTETKIKHPIFGEVTQLSSRATFEPKPEDTK